ncbi:hypothetical protein AB6A40_005537 [Gnathostoma spinigerum]|uniref:Uncharacterized protein n=1 Tax=Gnathostoma spinigerum TaxID=75299 RepID=A0ABD6EFW1_9BILA
MQKKTSNSSVEAEWLREAKFGEVTETSTNTTVSTSDLTGNYSRTPSSKLYQDQRLVKRSSNRMTRRRLPPSTTKTMSTSSTRSYSSRSYSEKSEAGSPDVPWYRCCCVAKKEPGSSEEDEYLENSFETLSPPKTVQPDADSISS